MGLPVECRCARGSQKRLLEESTCGGEGREDVEESVGVQGRGKLGTGGASHTDGTGRR